MTGRVDFDNASSMLVSASTYFMRKVDDQCATNSDSTAVTEDTTVNRVLIGVESFCATLLATIEFVVRGALTLIAYPVAHYALSKGEWQERLINWTQNGAVESLKTVLKAAVAFVQNFYVAPKDNTNETVKKIGDSLDNWFKNQDAFEGKLSAEAPAPAASGQQPADQSAQTQTATQPQAQQAASTAAPAAAGQPAAAPATAVA